MTVLYDIQIHVITRYVKRGWHCAQIYSLFQLQFHKDVDAGW